MKDSIARPTGTSRSSAIRVLVVSVTAALAPSASYAQSSSVSDKGFFGGASAGVYFESSEGESGRAPEGSGSIGYRFNRHWAVQAEIGATGTVYCYRTVSTALPGGGFNHPTVPHRPRLGPG